MRRLLARLRTEQTGAAYAAIEMVLVLGIILLPLLAGLAQLPRWVDARSTADLAAQEAAREMVLADSYEEGFAAAETVAATIVGNRGLDVGAIVGLQFEGVLARGETVTATVTLRVPPVILPGVGAVGGDISVSRSATERVDDYRQFGAP
ncbi:MAG: TadE family protein [Acidimicrobiia bacterium]